MYLQRVFEGIPPVTQLVSRDSYSTTSVLFKCQADTARGFEALRASCRMAAMSIATTDPRLQQATDWARQILDERELRLEAISGDASFRRYFRIHRSDGPTLVLMDAPPKKEDSQPFIDVAARLHSAGLHAPEVLHFDTEQGFGIIEDLGDRLYRDVINTHSATTIFPALFDLLACLARDVAAGGLPPYDEAMMQADLDLFPDWYLGRHKSRPFTASERRAWEALCRALIENAKAQPQVFVHRDFHSSNLMVRGAEAPGIIDFQDAVKGPLSYDFISLIWDRYIRWPRSRIESWMADMHARLVPGFGLEKWVRHCDLMGLQRNLKIVGIFARLRYRDHKHGYVEMIPMFYQYLLDVLPRYPEFGNFLAVVEDPACAP